MFKSCSAGVFLLVALHGAAAFHMPSALPSARLGSARATASRPTLRTARVPMMSSAPQKERTVRAPVFDEVCEQTGITLSRCDFVARAKKQQVCAWISCHTPPGRGIFLCGVFATACLLAWAVFDSQFPLVMPCQTRLEHNIPDSLRRYMMEVSRQNPDMRDLESLISGIQQVQYPFPTDHTVWVASDPCVLFCA